MKFPTKFHLRTNFRNFVLILCILYMLLVMVFHRNLNSEDVHHSNRGFYLKPRDSLLDSIVGQDSAGERPGSHFSNKSIPVLKKEANEHLNFGGTDNRRDKMLHSNGTCIGRMVEETRQFIEVSPKFYVYSVFWDSRTNDFDNIDGGVYLRIMTVIARGIANQNHPLYCLFENIDNRNTSYTAVLATYYEMCENHGKSYGGYILSCLVPEHLYSKEAKVPLCSVRLSASGKPEKGIDFHVIDTKPRTNSHSFSICTAPLYGDIPQVKLVEFIELSSMLGAEHITFYDFDISGTTRNLLRYYEKNSKVSVIPWALPDFVDSGVWYHGQLIAILDCLYRNMATTKYLAFNDIDEFMVPYGYRDWTDMMAQLDKPEHCGYQFNSAFFDPNLADRVEDPKALSFVSFTHSKKTVQSSSIRTKCMVKPYQLFEAGIHHISKPILAHLQTIRLDLPDALLHHYRTCQGNYRMNCREFETNHRIQEVYGERLRENVEEKMRIIDNLVSSTKRIE